DRGIRHGDLLRLSRRQPVTLCVGASLEQGREGVNAASPSMTNSNRPLSTHCHWCRITTAGVSKYPLYILCPTNTLTLSSSDNLRLSSQASGALLICGECFDE